MMNGSDKCSNLINRVKRFFKRDVPKMNIVDTVHVQAFAPKSHKSRMVRKHAFYSPEHRAQLNLGKDRAAAKKRKRRAMAKRSRKINSMLSRGKVCRTI